MISFFTLFNFQSEKKSNENISRALTRQDEGERMENHSEKHTKQQHQNIKLNNHEED